MIIGKIAFEFPIHSTAEGLQKIRDDLFALAEAKREDLVLVAGDESGTLAWEALRRAVDGGVYVQVTSPEAAQVIQSHAAGAMGAPVLLVGAPHEVETKLRESSGENVRFDLVLGRNLSHVSRDLTSILSRLVREGGRLVLAEKDPEGGQRLCELLGGSIGDDLYEKLKAAEDGFYRKAADARARAFPGLLADAGFSGGEAGREALRRKIYLSARETERWAGGPGGGGNYLRELGGRFTAEEAERIAEALGGLTGRKLDWTDRVIYYKFTRNRG